MSDPSAPLSVITHNLERVVIHAIADEVNHAYLAAPTSPTASPNSGTRFLEEEVKSPKRPVKISFDTQFVFYVAKPLSDPELKYLTEILDPVRVYNSNIDSRSNLQDLPAWKAIIFDLGDTGTHNFVERVWKVIHENEQYCSIAVNNAGLLTDMNPALEVLEAQLLMTQIDITKSGEDFLQDLQRTVLPPVKTGLWAGIRKLLVYEFLGTKIWTLALNVALWGLYSGTGKCHDTVAQTPEAPTAAP